MERTLPQPPKATTGPNHHSGIPNALQPRLLLRTAQTMVGIRPSAQVVMPRNMANQPRFRSALRTTCFRNALNETASDSLASWLTLSNADGGKNGSACAETDRIRSSISRRTSDGTFSSSGDASEKNVSTAVLNDFDKMRVSW